MNLTQASVKQMMLTKIKKHNVLGSYKATLNEELFKVLINSTDYPVLFGEYVDIDKCTWTSHVAAAYQYWLKRAQTVTDAEKGIFILNDYDINVKLGSDHDLFMTVRYKQPAWDNAEATLYFENIPLLITAKDNYKFSAAAKPVKLAQQMRALSDEFHAKQIEAEKLAFLRKGIEAHYKEHLVTLKRMASQGHTTWSVALLEYSTEALKILVDLFIKDGFLIGQDSASPTQIHVSW